MAATSRPKALSADRWGSTVRVPRSQPPAYGQLEGGQLVEQRPEEHDDGAGAAGGVDVDAREVEARRGHDLEVVAVGQPAHPDTDRGEHLDDPVDLLDEQYGGLAQLRIAD